MNETSLLLAFATCAAFAATNLDSAALIFAFSGTARPEKVFAAFVSVGACVVLASLIISLLASSVDIPARLFGLVPLFVGFSQLAQGMRNRPAGPLPPTTTSLSVMVTCFLSCSADNLSVFVAVLVKNGPANAFWVSGLLGLLYVLAGLVGALAGYRLVRPSVRLRALGPVTTACVGLAMLVG